MLDAQNPWGRRHKSQTSVPELAWKRTCLVARGRRRIDRRPWRCVHSWWMDYLVDYRVAFLRFSNNSNNKGSWSSKFVFRRWFLWEATRPRMHRFLTSDGCLTGRLPHSEMQLTFSKWPPRWRAIWNSFRWHERKVVSLRAHIWTSCNVDKNVSVPILGQKQNE